LEDLLAAIDPNDFSDFKTERIEPALVGMGDVATPHHCACISVHVRKQLGDNDIPAQFAKPFY
tara:strand:- start:72 stop:260 length:189 start_codon:yes stop_codon:yes gene_type:complete